MSWRTLSLSACLSLAGFAFGQEAARPQWEEEAMLLYSESALEFSQLRGVSSERNPRLIQYSRALDALHDADRDPRARQSLARRMLEELVEERADDPIALGSLYYLARIAEAEQPEGSEADAKELYLKLFERHPQRFFGQMALLKYATLEIYTLDEEAKPVQERLEEIETSGQAISRPEIRRNFHRILGEAYYAHELQPTKAYEHLEAAFTLGIPVVSLRMDVLSKMAELAEGFGDYESARRCYDELGKLATQSQRRDGFERKAEEMRQRQAGAR